MIKDLLTIVIPCKDCVIPIKKTIENIKTKTRIAGTRILVLDFGSTDGSYQYVAQASSDLSYILKIESIRMKSEECISDVESSIITPYVLVVKPGVVSDDPDIIMNSINKVLTGNNTLVYLKDLGIINRVISIFKKSDNPSLIFSKREVILELKYNPEDPEQNITTDLPLKVEGFIKY